MENEHKTEPLWVCFAFTLNSILGASVLALAYSYSIGGIAFGLSVQILAAIISFIISNQVLQSWSRIEMIKALKQKGYTILPVPLKCILQNKLGNYVQDESDDQNLVEKSELLPEIQRKYEFCEIAELTLGVTASKILGVVFVLHLTPSLISYGSLFATCLTSNVTMFGRETCNLYDSEDYFSECKVTYWGYLGIFTGIMVGLCFFQMREIKYWQILTCGLRILVFGLVIGTAVVAIGMDRELEGEGSIGADPIWFDVTGGGSLFTIVFLATLYQNTLPLTSSFMEDKEKNLSILIWSLSIFSFLLFTTMAILSNYATDDVEKAIILNWRDYSAGHSTDNKPWWCYLISYTVILLPAFDVASAFPIVCTSLAGNMLNIYSDSKPDYWTELKWKISITLFTCGVAAIMYDVSVILQIAGFFNIIDCMIFVPLFCIAAMLIIPKPTQYDFPHMYEVSIGILIFTVLLLIALFVNAIIELIAV